MAVTGQENIFGALLRWSKIEEDYYSKSLVLILKELQAYGDQGKRWVADFLSSVFGNRVNFVLHAKYLNITDHVGERNRPDIVIQDGKNLAYIEIKVNDELRNSDLAGYRREVDERAKKGGEQPFLFGLTRYGNDNEPVKMEGQASWINVWRRLKDIETNLETEVVGGNKAPKSYYMIQDFIKFLKESGMGVEQVTKIFSSDDLHNFVKLTSLIKAGCVGAGLKLDNEAKPRIEIGDEDNLESRYIGWWFKPQSREKGQAMPGYWCGFYLNKPDQLVFEIHGSAFEDCRIKLARRKPELDKKFPDWDLDRVKHCAGFPKTLPGNFTALSAAEQVEWISGFIKSVLESVGFKIPD